MSLVWVRDGVILTNGSAPYLCDICPPPCQPCDGVCAAFEPWAEVFNSVTVDVDAKPKTGSLCAGCDLLDGTFILDRVTPYNPVGFMGIYGHMFAYDFPVPVTVCTVGAGQKITRMIFGMQCGDAPFGVRREIGYEFTDGSGGSPSSSVVWTTVIDGTNHIINCNGSGRIAPEDASGVTATCIGNGDATYQLNV